MKFTAGDIADRLTTDIHGVCKYLLPQGEEKSGEWLAGSVHGDAGKSLKVSLSGPKKGRWCDFADEDQRGDLLDLWAACRGLDLGEAFREACDYLGVEMPRLSQERKPARIKAPQNSKAVSEQSTVMSWLRDRGFSQQTVKKLRLAERDGAVMFPAFSPAGKLQYVKYRSVADKKFWSEAGGIPCLFGWQAMPGSVRATVVCEGECFPGDAQILTKQGWLQLADYSGGEVAQYHDGCIEWVHPIARVEKYFNGDLIRYETRGYVSITTPDHNLVSIDHKGREYKHTAAQASRSCADSIPRVGILDGQGINLSDDQIRLAIAVSADAAIDTRTMKKASNGSTIAKERRYARFAFRKNRKINRLREILVACDLPASDNLINDGHQSICLSIPDWVPGRFLPWAWIANATLRQRELILDELVHWDGNTVPNRNQTEYSSKYIENAEWVQTLAHSTGRVSSIIHRKNQYGQWLKVSILHSKKTTSWQTLKKHEQRIPHDGKVYCVQVPSGALMVRQEEKITVSGNCDVLAWTEFGIPALSPTNGAGNASWIETEFDNLARFDTIFLSFDMDDAGQSAIAEIAERLGQERCRIVELPQKDANDCLRQGMTSEQMWELLAAAKTLDPQELVNAASFEDELIAYRDSGGTDAGIPLPFAFDDKQFLLRQGELIILAGVNGSGKTELANQLTLHAASIGQRACIGSFEFKAVKLMDRIQRQAGAMKDISDQYSRAISRWFDDRLWLFVPQGRASTDRLLDVFEYAVRRYNIRWFVIDNLAKCGIPEDDYNAQKRFAERLSEFARDTDSTVILCAHQRKGQDETRPSGKMDVKGTGALTDMADSVMVLWKNKEKARERERAETAEQFGADPEFDESQDVDGLLIIEKQRNGETEPVFRLWYHFDSHQYIARHGYRPIRYVQWQQANQRATV